MRSFASVVGLSLALYLTAFAGGLARAEGHQAVGGVGLAFSEDDRAIHLYPSGRRLPSPVVRCESTGNDIMRSGAAEPAW